MFVSYRRVLCLILFIVSYAIVSVIIGPALSVRDVMDLIDKIVLSLNIPSV
jgi:hypothetical protein